MDPRVQWARTCSFMQSGYVISEAHVGNEVTTRGIFRPKHDRSQYSLEIDKNVFHQHASNACMCTHCLWPEPIIGRHGRHSCLNAKSLSCAMLVDHRCSFYSQSHSSCISRACTSKSNNEWCGHYEQGPRVRRWLPRSISILTNQSPLLLPHFWSWYWRQ